MKLNLNDIKIALRDLRQTEKYPPSDGGTVQSAVLVPLFSLKGELSLVYTRRAGNLARHAGQVSFPGGVREGDEQTPEDTALRETCEEIGLSPGRIEVVGQMMPYNSSTGFCVFPVVGIIHDANGIRNNYEVERLFFVPLVWLQDPANSYKDDYASADGKNHQLWFFKVFNEEKIWGLTAQITKDFLALIQKER